VFLNLQEKFTCVENNRPSRQYKNLAITMFLEASSKKCVFIDKYRDIPRRGIFDSSNVQVNNSEIVELTEITQSNKLINK